MLALDEDAGDGPLAGEGLEVLLDRGAVWEFIEFVGFVGLFVVLEEALGHSAIRTESLGKHDDAVCSDHALDVSEAGR